MADLNEPIATTVLRSMKMTYDAGSIHDHWFMVLWQRVGEMHEVILPARTRDEAISYVQGRLQALKINGSGRWLARELCFGPWRPFADLPGSSTRASFWTPDMLDRAEAASLNSRTKIQAAFDREIQRLDTLQRQFTAWAAGER